MTDQERLLTNGNAESDDIKKRIQPIKTWAYLGILFAVITVGMALYAFIQVLINTSDVHHEFDAYTTTSERQFDADMNKLQDDILGTQLMFDTYLNEVDKDVLLLDFNTTRFNVDFLTITEDISTVRARVSTIIDDIVALERILTQKVFSRQYEVLQGDGVILNLTETTAGTTFLVNSTDCDIYLPSRVGYSARFVMVHHVVVSSMVNRIHVSNGTFVGYMLSTQANQFSYPDAGTEHTVNIPCSNTYNGDFVDIQVLSGDIASVYGAVYMNGISWGHVTC